MRIIPAIDIINGKCVRLTKGDYNTKKIYSDNPVEVAKRFENHGIEYLHVVDLDGAKAQHIVNHKVLHQICNQTKLKVDFGGGVKSHDDIKTAFNAGARQITAGSIAVKNPPLVLEWLAIYGSDKIVLGADCYNRSIVTTGWTESSEEDVIAFIKYYESKGMRYTICTDVSKDGMLAGVSDQLYKDIIDDTGIKLIASGGVSSIADLKTLKTLGCDGAIIGKALYEEKITLSQIQQIC